MQFQPTGGNQPQQAPPPAAVGAGGQPITLLQQQQPPMYQQQAQPLTQQPFVMMPSVPPQPVSLCPAPGIPPRVLPPQPGFHQQSLQPQHPHLQHGMQPQQQHIIVGGGNLPAGVNPHVQHLPVQFHAHQQQQQPAAIQPVQQQPATPPQPILQPMMGTPPGLAQPSPLMHTNNPPLPHCAKLRPIPNLSAHPLHGRLSHLEVRCQSLSDFPLSLAEIPPNCAVITLKLGNASSIVEPKSVCRESFKNTGCAKGNKCTFIHPPSKDWCPMPDQICNQWAQKKSDCRTAHNGFCKYLHGTRELLQQLADLRATLYNRQLLRHPTDNVDALELGTHQNLIIPQGGLGSLQQLPGPMIVHQQPSTPPQGTFATPPPGPDSSASSPTYALQPRQQLASVAYQQQPSPQHRVSIVSSTGTLTSTPTTPSFVGVPFQQAATSGPSSPDKFTVPGQVVSCTQAPSHPSGSDPWGGSTSHSSIASSLGGTQLPQPVANSVGGLNQTVSLAPRSDSGTPISRDQQKTSEGQDPPVLLALNLGGQFTNGGGQGGQTPSVSSSRSERSVGVIGNPRQKSN